LQDVWAEKQNEIHRRFPSPAEIDTEYAEIGKEYVEIEQEKRVAGKALPNIVEKTYTFNSYDF